MCFNPTWTIIDAKIENEKYLRDWKLPPFSPPFANQYKPRSCFNPSPLYTIKTLEKKISLPEGYSTIPLLAKCSKIANSSYHDYLEVGMIQVGLKPKKLGSNTSAKICVVDMRRPNYQDSVLAMAESSLRNGPICFSCFPDCDYLDLSSTSASDYFFINVKIDGSSSKDGGNRNVTLLFRLTYRLLKKGALTFVRRNVVDEKGKTTLYVTDIAQNRVVSNTISWGETEVENLFAIGPTDLSKIGLISLSGEEKATSSDAGVANVDWKETEKAHVLKVDVPGFNKDEVKFEVEDGGILRIFAEGSNEEEEEESGKWHRKERRSGFVRRWRMPENGNFDEMKVCMGNGVLKITVPKKEVKMKKPGDEDR